MQAGGARLLDVREPAAFALAHVPGALSVPAGEASPGGTFFRFHADFADHVERVALPTRRSSSRATRAPSAAWRAAG